MRVTTKDKRDQGAGICGKNGKLLTFHQNVKFDRVALIFASKYWAADLYCSWKCGGGLEQKLIINSYIWPQNLFEDSTQFRSKLLGNVK